MPGTVAFIGSGAIGSAVARLTVAAGLDVVLSNSRGPDSLSGLVTELGGRASAATTAEAARAAGVVAVAIPFGLYDRLPAEALVGRTVIDTMNYYPEHDGRIGELEDRQLTSSEMLQRHLPGSRVVKTLNNMDSVRLFTGARPAHSPERSALAVSSCDAGAKADVVRFLDAIGYDAVDIGTLADSWRQEPGTPVNVHPYLPDPPTDMTPEEAREWFLKAPPVTVTAARVTELTAQATRACRVGGRREDLPPGLLGT
ncbi:NAD(P)-binding domain-containing protein [Streptomyces sp. NPDC047061]|uniref:NADPH-dependent F420 reductase n=1 Tax=Streptomyces sp. NPDC047061 TaxID=3154605 RepID=UPI0033C740AD